MKLDPLKKNKHGATIRATFLSMALNIVLAKIVCGVAARFSITTDGFNNLSDCGGNIITLIGAKAAAI